MNQRRSCLFERYPYYTTVHQQNHDQLLKVQLGMLGQVNTLRKVIFFKFHHEVPITVLSYDKTDIISVSDYKLKHRKR